MDERSARRRVLRIFALAGGTAVLPGIARDARAQAKASKAAMKYQDQPKGDQRCSGCMQFVAPNQCKVVEGDISPNGWCVAYAAKPK
ncbi:MAG: iron oxidase [Betaproteobacteria bacterium]|nr:MAG: iron oxidase [Betaproteobacteria bacterium]